MKEIRNIKSVYMMSLELGLILGNPAMTDTISYHLQGECDENFMTMD